MVLSVSIVPLFGRIWLHHPNIGTANSSNKPLYSPDDAISPLKYCRLTVERKIIKYSKLKSECLVVLLTLRYR